MTQVDPAYKRLNQFRHPNESNEDFGGRLGVSQQTVSNWENGSRISRDTLERAAEKFGVSLDWLVYGREVEGHPNRPAIADQLRKVIEWMQGEAVDWTPPEPVPVDTPDFPKGEEVSESDAAAAAGRDDGGDDGGSG